MGRMLRGWARAPGSLGRKGGRKLGTTITIPPLRKPGTVAHIFNLSTDEAEVSGLP